MIELIGSLLKDYRFTAARYLDFIKKAATVFFDYSFRNQLLIYLQNPNAKDLRAFTQWSDIGRKVKKGERGIYIAAPYLVDKKIGDSEEIISRIKFKKVLVFDVSQTTSDITVSNICELDFDEEQIFNSICAAHNVQAVFKKFDERTDGFFSEQERKVYLNLSLRSKELLFFLLILIFQQSDNEDKENRNFSSRLFAFTILSHYNFSISQNCLNLDFAKIQTEDFIKIAFKTFDKSACTIQKINSALKPQNEFADVKTKLTLAQKIEIAKQKSMRKEETAWIN